MKSMDGLVVETIEFFISGIDIHVPDKYFLEIIELFKLQHPRTLINYIIKFQSFSAAVSVTLINDFIKLERFSVAATMTLLN